MKAFKIAIKAHVKAFKIVNIDDVQGGFVHARAMHERQLVGRLTVAAIVFDSTLNLDCFWHTERIVKCLCSYVNRRDEMKNST